MISEAYNMDCLAAMREMPDKAFDLAVVDPPYGGGSQIVQVERERERENCAAARQNGISANAADSAGISTVIISATRTGGTWSRKYQRERQRRQPQTLAIGMLRRRQNTLNSLPEFRKTKSYGAAIISDCHQQGAF